MKFGQLIEYNEEHFFEKSYTKYARETIPRSLPKKSKLNSVKFKTACFYYMLTWGLSKYSEIKLQKICFYLI